MRAILQRYPIILFTAGVILVVAGISATLRFIPADARLSWTALASLGFLVFTSLLLGIVSFWWHTLRQLDTSRPDAATAPTPRLDLSDLFFQTTSIVGWYQNNLSRLHGKFADVERISHLLSYLNFTADLHRQIRIALQFAQEFFPTGTLLVYLHAPTAPLEFACGTRPRRGDIAPELAPDDPLVRQTAEIIRQEIDLDSLATQDWKSFSLPLKRRVEPADLSILPLLVWNRILGLVVFMNAERKALSEDEKVLASLFNRQLAISIENHLLYRENIRRERLTYEVDVARTLQTSSLPSQPPLLRGFDIHATCMPCHEISGDYYDLVPLPNDRLLVAVADVSGKGLPAALFLSKIQALVRAMADSLTSPGQLLSFLSRQLSKDQMGSLFATMIIAVFTADSRTVVCASAGHCRPLVVRTGSGFVEEVEFEAGIPLGLFEQEENAYPERCIELLPGDGVFLYTDGVIDLLNRERERFGVERLKTALDNAPEGKASSLVYHVMAGMNRFKETYPHEDDITMVYVKSEKASS
ncbi:MAG TPA: SpoIIE family protein phosphatase [Candidatus Ozemobacteraceae bacterium]|nr:SpoIIE family protein phosphatase [Candidatus Ozemobacteraceae bacterium]